MEELYDEKIQDEQWLTKRFRDLASVRLSVLLRQAPTNLSFLNVDPKEPELSPAIASASSPVFAFCLVVFSLRKVADDVHYEFLLDVLASHCASMPTVLELQAWSLLGSRMVKKIGVSSRCRRSPSASPSFGERRMMWRANFLEGRA